MNVVGEKGEKEPDSSYKDEVKLQKYDKDLYGLNRNGHPLRCPFIIPTPVASVCNSACPLFMMGKKSDNKYRITLGCGSGHTEHVVTEIIPYIEKKKS